MSEVAPVRGYAKGRRKRLEIIEAATGLFGEVGYRAASLREISSRVGISHPGLLHHFPTKETLLAAVLEHRDELDEVRLAEDRSEGVGFFAALVQMVQRNQSQPGMIELYAMLSIEATVPDHPAHAYFQQRYQSLIERISEELARMVDDDRLPASTDMGATARSIVALMDGLQVQWLMDRDRPDERVDMAAALRAHLWLLGRVEV
ncbi:DNA-binding transcriptional regulator, AcrR family [Paraoerskovia marina]|uniref:DNA-binding transcriptional regulator, AcrR family n=1 Tax=Paraoerskovia marina TaxID=545619 RepID=A0A1H1LVA6_9CELL|nr:TetR/AcrR family transcriptional regulator [Paraoerskovia marina]SDR78466.1 DNA-binding transcriptional regulator, AcrR family [Paraoerskovia marina]